MAGGMQAIDSLVLRASEILANTPVCPRGAVRVRQGKRDERQPHAMIGLHKTFRETKEG